jgi:hypothetical protein
MIVGSRPCSTYAARWPLDGGRASDGSSDPDGAGRVAGSFVGIVSGDPASQRKGGLRQTFPRKSGSSRTRSWRRPNGFRQQLGLRGSRAHVGHKKRPAACSSESGGGSTARMPSTPRPFERAQPTISAECWRFPACFALTGGLPEPHDCAVCRARGAEVYPFCTHLEAAREEHWASSGGRTTRRPSSRLM